MWARRPQGPLAVVLSLHASFVANLRVGECGVYTIRTPRAMRKTCRNTQRATASCFPSSRAAHLT